MKTLFVSLVALLFAFFLGCQNSITDPVVPETNQLVDATDEETLVYKDVFNVTYPNVIRLEGLLLDPSHRLNSYAQIEGVVRYGIKKLNSRTAAEIPIEFYKVGLAGTPDENKKVDIYVDAQLKANCPHSNSAWTVKKAVDQIITVNTTNQLVTYIQKSFRLKNTCCAPLNLALKFEVNKNELKLVSMELKLASRSEPIIDQE